MYSPDTNLISQQYLEKQLNSDQIDELIKKNFSVAFSINKHQQLKEESIPMNKETVLVLSFDGNLLKVCKNQEDANNCAEDYIGKTNSKIYFASLTGSMKPDRRVIRESL